jgi:O-succinylbenzoic acid--CoA ligase
LAGGSTLFAGYGYPPVPPASPFPTKDVGAYHERFGFSVQGRKDFQFISGGENIQPEEIEAALLTHKEVEEAIVVPLFDEEFGARPAAWIRSTLTHKELLLHLSSQLPNYKFPVVFASLKESETLKPNRSTLIEEMNKNFTFIF